MDWKQVIQDLIDAGMTQVEIAGACEVAQSSVSALASGATASPRYEFGKCLERLQADRCAKPAPAIGAQAPEVSGA